MPGLPAYAVEGAIEHAREEGAAHVVVVSNGDYELVSEDENVNDVYDALKSSNEFLTPDSRDVSIGVIDLDD